MVPLGAPRSYAATPTHVRLPARTLPPPSRLPPARAPPASRSIHPVRKPWACRKAQGQRRRNSEGRTPATSLEPRAVWTGDFLAPTPTPSPPPRPTPRGDSRQRPPSAGTSSRDSQSSKMSQLDPIRRPSAVWDYQKKEKKKKHTHKKQKTI